MFSGLFSQVRFGPIIVVNSLML